jgi:hypothetical protein
VPPSAVLELRLDSGFAADAFHPCRRLLGFDGTTAATGAGLAHLRAATVCFPRRRYFQWTLFSTNTLNCCVFLLYYILIVQGAHRYFRQSCLDSRRRRRLERRSFRYEVSDRRSFSLRRQIFLPRPLRLCSSLVSTRPPRTTWAGKSLGTLTFSRPWMPRTKRRRLARHS